jgi:periplasmic protein TonB
MSFAQQPARDRAASAAAVLLCHALLAWVLISGLKLSFTPAPSDPLTVFDTRTPPPPPVEEAIPPRARTDELEGEAAPPNLKSVASPVVAPKPEVQLDARSPVTAAPMPREGPDRSSGAAPVSGPGTGAGGAGTGTGSGGSGAGTGSGGNGSGGAPVRRARLIRGALSVADYPSSLRGSGIGGRVNIHMIVEPSGRVSRCSIAESSGSPELDAITCRLVQERYLFEPARDARGQPVRDIVGEGHTWFSRRRGR